MRGVSLLQGLYDEYHPHKEEAVAFESVCYRLGRACELAGDRSKADVYYREAKDLILTRPLSFQVFETVDPLMNAFYVRTIRKIYWNSCLYGRRLSSSITTIS